MVDSKALLENAIDNLVTIRGLMDDQERSQWTPEGMTDAEYIEKLIGNSVELMKMLGWTRKATFAKRLCMKTEELEAFLAKEEPKKGEKPSTKIPKGQVARRRREGHRVRTKTT